MSGKGRQTQRLDKVLTHMGYGSRSDIKRQVKQGMITVNGRTTKDSGLQVHPYNDQIEVNGERVVFREYVYIMLHKPPGVISATEDTRERTVLDLLSAEERNFEPFPVGRLDKDTEGLLLLTNDGKLAHELLSPRRHVPKTYEATVSGHVTEEDVHQFAAGVELDDGYVTLPAQLTILRYEKAQEDEEVISYISLVIHEGKFHQVKRMFEAVGKKVTYLKRTAMGPLTLDDQLPLGSYRELTNEELAWIGRDLASATSEA
ncbi:16S rRNA pseudouridine(516) synthase [Paenibacillus sp. IHB B 3084]|uniref:pseudouridine synthase n=1 Tax=unclassified Paenibacillus TaxID=185978 RepID=UPI0007229185|nr:MULTISPECIES: pseudouridine synthase [unclassified Paenibacillus]ALP35181.1 16S rRNA pseudouridine(516) synthase [Paenibacillus sp. IHB B 3084]MBE0336542.1 rRNA pseudouridine synthase [Paenibacillus sp. 23TSA30-6]